MLGRVIDEVLTDKERGRLLTSPMRPGQFIYPSGERCFWGIVDNVQFDGWSSGDRFNTAVDQLMPGGCRIIAQCVRMGGDWFDALCERFGVPRIANAIRNRVLSPRSRAERIASRVASLETQKA